MYAAHFGLDELPFEPLRASPDAFWSRSLREALEQFLYARRSGEGFMLVVGEPGAGKSVALATMIAALDAETPVAVVRHPTLGPRELLEEIARKFGLALEENESKPHLLGRLEALFRRSLESERRPVLAIDEAQLLSPSAFEEVRLLTNLERDHAPMLQVVIAGQPEIVDRLRSPRLRQLRQRISLRVHVSPLTWVETKDYLAHCLRQSGSSHPKTIFSDAAITALQRLTGGLPRELNVVARQAMVSAYLAERTTVLPEDVDAVPKEFGFESVAASVAAAPRAPAAFAKVPAEPAPIDEPAPIAETDAREIDSSEIDLVDDDVEVLISTSNESRRFARALGTVLALAACAAVLALFLYEAPSSEFARMPAIPEDPVEASTPDYPDGSDSDEAFDFIEPSDEPPEETPPPAPSPAPEPAEQTLAPPPPAVATPPPISTTVAPERLERPARPGSIAPLDDVAAAELEAVNLLERGSDLAERGRMDEAIVFFRRVVELRPDGFSGRYNLGTALLAAGAPEEAAEELRRAASLSPESAAAARNLGRALLQSGATEDAAGALARAVELAPSDASGHELLGIALGALGKVDEAIESYRRAVELAPRDAVALQRLGLALRDAGRVEESVGAFRQAVALAPDSARAHEYLGMALLSTGENDDAIEALRRGVELSPEDARAHHNLGYALKQDHRLEESIEAFGRATELDPEFGLAFYSQGLALREAGYEAEAERSMQMAARLGFSPNR